MFSLPYRLRLLLVGIIDTATNIWSFHVIRARERKLETLRQKWSGIPKGKLVIMLSPVYVTKVNKPGQEKAGGPGGYGNPTWVNPGGHIIQPGQGAMIMKISFPEVKENWLEEEPIRFVFWCNDDLYEWQNSLEHFSGTLPFGVLD